MTKEQLVEFIGKALPTPQHPEMISMAIGRAFNQLLYSTFRKDLSNLDLYTRSYNSEILIDEARDVYYAEIPQQIVQLPEPGDGIRDITPSKEKGIYFVPLAASAMRMFSVCDEPSAYVGWCIRNQRVEFESGRTMPVTMHLIIPFELYDDEENVYLPVGADDELIRLTASFLSVMRPENKIIDSTHK